MSELSDRLTSDSKEGLEKTVSPPTPFLRKIWDTAKAVPLYGASYLLGGTPLAVSAALGGAAYLVGYSIETFRKDVKWRWRDAYKDVVTGSLFGAASYGLFEGFRGYEAVTAADRWKKTAAYVGLAAGAGIPFYRGAVYLREEVGVYETLKSIFRRKGNTIGGYLKDAWNYDIKKNWAKMAFRTAAFITLPIHLILNFVPGGSVAKVATQKGLTVANRLIQGGKASIQKYDAPKKENIYNLPEREKYQPNNYQLANVA